MYRKLERTELRDIWRVSGIAGLVIDDWRAEQPRLLLDRAECICNGLHRFRVWANAVQLSACTTKCGMFDFLSALYVVPVRLI